ncbi:DNA mismatch repair protein MutS [Chengkuizengella axinellae]|uniref:DNA mismatch repair protein MutS n=1 Tax=Chengkuizengella axinellae TaxID=3064388 RepID=A0ABT9IX89_9BACL|nr:DNA mismatch repair protein MutS [Chengkuizengella sp. 2205SS18-9]MDP5273967.1 DNA mismatch repair protein MutS [Chengkuizengella sp. 2205SS18-9]
MVKYTPMMEQYLEIKEKAKDAFLFFRLGDFYELFFEDAKLAAQELEITLTGREGGAKEKIPMCGVPYHSAEQYIAKLIQKGYKVAICEQVQNPAEAKGVVKREIVRVITPGTVMEGKMLGDRSNNFIVCVSQLNDTYSLAACDLTSGELYETTGQASLDFVIDEIGTYAPVEIVTETSLYPLLQEKMIQISRTILLNAWKQKDNFIAAKQFKPELWEPLSDSSKHCISVLMSYLNETQKRTLSHITNIKSYENNQYMTLDPFTRRNLELVETIRDQSKKGSLLWLLDQTVTSMGSRLLKRWVDKPLMSITAINYRLNIVDTLYQQFILREDLREKLKNVYDLERLVGRISYGNANARDLVALKKSLEQVPALVNICENSGSDQLMALVHSLDQCTDIKERIGKAIIEDPPISVKDGSMIKEGYHEYLDQLREASVNGKQWLAELEQREREITGIKKLKIGYNKVFGYFIEITKANINHLPEGRYERKQTLANAERFITPELKEKEALILEAEDKMVEIEYELFHELRNELKIQIPRLQHLASIISTLDVYQSLAKVSADHQYCKPAMTNQYNLIVREGRHPVVEAISKDQTFISNDTLFESGNQNMLLITGPNMAGKSTYMRQVSLVCIMAQIGCFVPATEAEIPVIDRIFTRIGAADDLVSGQSTFMVEMKDIQVMTEKASPKSLVIIDELGRGTSTSEGMSIAQAVIEFLHNEIGCKTLVSTHFHELAHLEKNLSCLKNYSMAVKESGDEVTFLRKLIKGAASTSYGIYCAQIAGIPNSIIERSYHLLSSFESRIEEGDGEQKDISVIRESAATKSVLDQEEQHVIKEDEADTIQLSFFEGLESKKLNVEDKQKQKNNENLIEKELRTLDLLNVTPLQAINILSDLKSKL